MSQPAPSPGIPETTALAWKYSSRGCRNVAVLVLRDRNHLQRLKLQTADPLSAKSLCCRLYGSSFDAQQLCM